MILSRDNAFPYYFHFMEERMRIFWRKIEGHSHLTDDPILGTYKFTNVYRVLDRVSQYLIAQVIYNQKEDFSPQDVLFRILIFKVFNRIDTWEFLEEALEEPISISNFSPEHYGELLAYRIQRNPIFSGAYLMTAGHKDFLHLRSKHERWLHMIQAEFIQGRAFDQLLEAKSMEAVYHILKSKPMIGNFLAYQYTIDFNYSPWINFDENSFVKAGIGAIRGIKKCFSNYADYSFEDCIRFTADHLQQFQEQFGYDNFQNLYGRSPTLIDLQNCFCETDKYLRVKLPELNQGMVRIKQKYKPQEGKIQYQFPPKWKLEF